MPPNRRLPEWERDYRAMAEMVFGALPDFSEVLEAMRVFEKEFNAGARG